MSRSRGDLFTLNELALIFKDMAHEQHTLVKLSIMSIFYNKTDFYMNLSLRHTIKSRSMYKYTYETSKCVNILRESCLRSGHSTDGH
jgi:hypothetical protein